MNPASTPTPPPAQALAARLERLVEVLGELVERQLQMRREMHQRMMQAEGGCGMPREGAGMRDCPRMRPDSTAAGGGHQMNH